MGATLLLVVGGCSESAQQFPLPDPCADVPAAQILVVEETQPASHPLPNDVAVDAEYVYWVDAFGDKVRRIPKNGGNVETLAEAGAPSRVAVDEQNVYWIGGLGDVSSVSKSGGPVTVLSGVIDCSIGFPCGEAIAVDAGSVYWIADSRLMSRLKQNGTPTEIPSQGLSDELVVDQTDIYWVATKYDGGFLSEIHASPKSGGADRTLTLPANAEPVAMTGDAANVYAAGSNGVWRIPKDGSEPVQLSPGPLTPRGVTTDGSNVYITESNRILRVSVLGGEQRPIACNQKSALRIAVDESNVYWNAEGADAIVTTPK